VLTLSVMLDQRIAVRSAAGLARVVSVEAIPVALPLRAPAQFASGTISTADNVIVRVHSDAGLVGCAEAQARPYTYGETQSSIVEAVNTWFGPRLIGVDPVAHERARAVTAGLEGNRCAASAVMVALADLAAQILGISCSAMLGGAADSVQVASMLSFREPDAMAAEAVELHERFGIAAFKVKVGRDPELDLAAVRAVRQAMPTAALYVDANRGWSLAQAQRVGGELIELGVEAIEEPLDLADETGRRRLAELWSVPLAGDESCLDLAGVADQLASHIVGQVSIKVARTAFDESAAILAYCRGCHVRTVVGSQYEGALGAWASIAFAASSRELCQRPAEASNFLDLAADLVAPPEIVDGRVHVSDASGLGVSLDEHALATYRVDR
jgi:L-alanine-DL-glutamate epimerase-like enolase superfamily enzyme